MEYDQFLKKACPPLDLDWRKYRRKAARKRVLARIKALGLNGFGGYLGHVRTHPDEAGALPEIMLVTVSRFWRDRWCWEGLTGEVIPALLRDSPALSMLSAGCCGGEEPYSLALAWKDILAPRFPGRTAAITAVDMDPASLARAGAGVYDGRTLRELPERMRERWFAPHKGRFRLSAEIRGMVEFRRMNLLREPMPGRQNLILCRYLFFTYFTGERRLRMARRLWEALAPGGALMVGGKEELCGTELELFAPWPDAPGVYRRRET